MSTIFGWVKLHRKLRDWEWYQDSQTVHLFIHILLLANHKERRWRGILIRPGQCATSYAHLSEETGISIRSVRTILGRLVTTQSLTRTSTHRYTMITICDWGTYQDLKADSDTPIDTQTDTVPHSCATPSTTNKNDQNDQNENPKTHSPNSLRSPMDVPKTLKGQFDEERETRHNTGQFEQVAKSIPAKSSRPDKTIRAELDAIGKQVEESIKGSCPTLVELAAGLVDPIQNDTSRSSHHISNIQGSN